MSATGQKVLKHPAKEEIDEKLLAGESVEAVAQWLKQKYSKRKSYWINKMTLQAYRKRYLNVKGEVLSDIQKERKTRQVRERTERKLVAHKSSPEYQTAIVKAAEEIELTVSDYKSQLEHLLVFTQERLEIMAAQKIGHLTEKVIVEQIRLQKELVSQFFDMERSLRADAEVNINIDVHKLTTEMKMIKVSLREAINEVCPELYSVFMAALTKNLEDARQHIDMDGLENTSGISINIRS